MNIQGMNGFNFNALNFQIHKTNNFSANDKKSGKCDGINTIKIFSYPANYYVAFGSNVDLIKQMQNTIDEKN